MSNSCSAVGVVAFALRHFTQLKEKIREGVVSQGFNRIIALALYNAKYGESDTR